MAHHALLFTPHVAGVGPLNSPQARETSIGPPPAVAQKLMTSERLPQTDSIDESANFWQTHDLADFDEELNEPAQPAFVREATFKLRLSEEAAAVERKRPQP